MANLLGRAALILSGGTIALAALALPVQSAAGQQASPAARSLVAGQARAMAGGWRLARTFSVRGRGRSVDLWGIDALGPANAWVAGAIQNDGLTKRVLIAHWDGGAWTRVAVPASQAGFRGAGFGVLGASSSRNVWVFSLTGSYLRLSGNRWQSGRLPRQVRTRQDYIDSTEVFSPADVWVFGFRIIGSSSKLKFAPFAARYNGTGWRVVQVGGAGGMGSVSAISPTSMWALTGALVPGTGLRSEPKVVHWNGRSWQALPVQPRLPRHATLTGILAEGRDDVWVGGSVPNNRTGTSELALRWNGTSWLPASPPAPASSADEYLTNLVPDGSGGLWAAAEAIPGPVRFWHYTGGAWSPPVDVSSHWLFPVLAAVPGSRSVWAIAASPGLINGLILVYGPLPR